MKTFMGDDFLLDNKWAERLYHEHARDLPVIDYHCHLPPGDIADDKKFANLTNIWLDGDHYKWRAMRACGIPEKYCTGDAPDDEKFKKWAETVPYTLRNPLYHWTHMELRRPFGITRILNPSTADAIYREANELLATDSFTARNIMRKFKVEVVCTTDDPADSLAPHRQIKDDGFEIRVLPTWRPDKAMAIEDPEAYNRYVGQLEEASGMTISCYDDLMNALQARHDFFHSMGCRLSDHGLDRFYADDFGDAGIRDIFKKVRAHQPVSAEMISKFKSAMLYEFGLMDAEKGWTQQFHVGALRNNSSRMYRQLGPDTGFDSIGDREMGRSMSLFFDKLDQSDRLTKTILYNLNPRDNAMMATMAGNFNDGRIPGKMQYGSCWWFLDQKDGIEQQLNTLSGMGLLSQFVGMLTDSRSFLSYPRHDYFRRILCNLIGTDMENGEIPADMELAGRMTEDICYYNAKRYFGF